jgi:hypothetical protein
MPRTYFGPFSAAYETDAEPAGGNTGRFPLGHYLVTPDGRKYRYALNDATVEVAGNLYQTPILLSNHQDRACDVARAIGAVVISASVGATAAGTDIYNEGVVHVDAAPGEGYAYRIRRAIATGGGHASVAGSDILTVNLSADQSVQVALTTASDVTFSRNRFREVILKPASQPTARLAGISPGVAAANRYYWSQVTGEAAVLGDGTLLEGMPAQASVNIAGAVESHKRRVTTGGTTASTSAGGPFLEDQDGADSALRVLSASVNATVDITGAIAQNAPVVGVTVQTNASTEYGLVDLMLLGS